MQCAKTNFWQMTARPLFNYRLIEAHWFAWFGYQNSNTGRICPVILSFLVYLTVFAGHYLHRNISLAFWKLACVVATLPPVFSLLEWCSWDPYLDCRHCYCFISDEFRRFVVSFPILVDIFSGCLWVSLPRKPCAE